MKFIVFIFLLGISQSISAQQSTGDLFQKIQSKVQNFKVDTSTVPNDRLTKEIILLRKAKGGFNIDEALLYKIKENLSKGEIDVETAQSQEAFFTTGNGKIWLNNAIIWIYRNNFTLKEIKKIKRFYQSAAGQAYSENFPIIMVESLQSAEKIIQLRKTEN